MLHLFFNDHIHFLSNWEFSYIFGKLYCLYNFRHLCKNNYKAIRKIFQFLRLWR